MTRRNVIYIRPAPKAGFLIWAFVALWYIGIVVPLIAVWLFCKFMVIGILWAATRIGIFLAARSVNDG